MKPWNNFFAVWTLLFLLASCSANQNLISPKPDYRANPIPPGGADRGLIVLLPDPDGKAGVIRVTTKVGYQILDKAGYVARIEDADHPPSLPERIDKNEIADIFGGALSAQPDLKDRFSSFILWFESGTTELTRASKQLLPEVLTTIRNRKSKEIYLVGHTDRVGSEAYNLRLSSSRACRVRDLLVLNGVKSKAIIVSFYGKARPLVYTEDETPEPLNRRVEVLIR